MFTLISLCGRSRVRAMFERMDEDELHEMEESGERELRGMLIHYNFCKTLDRLGLWPNIIRMSDE